MSVGARGFGGGLPPRGDGPKVMLHCAARVSDRGARWADKGGRWVVFVGSGGDGHAAATTSAITTVAGPEFLRTLVLVVARPPPLVLF